MPIVHAKTQRRWHKDCLVAARIIFGEVPMHLAKVAVLGNKPQILFSADYAVFCVSDTFWVQLSICGHLRNLRTIMNHEEVGDLNQVHKHVWAPSPVPNDTRQFD